MNAPGKASCVCGHTGPAKTIARHRHGCYKWRKHREREKELARQKQRKQQGDFALIPI